MFGSHTLSMINARTSATGSSSASAPKRRSRTSPERPRQSPEKQSLLFANTARAIKDAPREIEIRHIGNCLKADPACGKGVADALGIPLSEIPT